MRTRILAALLLIVGVGIGLFTFYSERPNSPVGKFPFKLGLDLNGGVHLVYKADVSTISKTEVVSSMQALRDVIEKRVNMFGVSEPVVQVEHGGTLSEKGAEEKLIVELPGVTNIEKAIEMIGRTPVLEFKLLKNKDVEALNSKKDLTEKERAEEISKMFIPTGLTGSGLSRSVLEFDSTTNQPTVGLVLTSDGKDLFAKITKENIGNVLAIFLDGTPISLPTIRTEIRDGKAQITGGFTLDQAKLLVRDLNYGALPVQIELISTQTVGASLGQDALWGGVRAGLWALVIIGIFLLVWYRLPGLIAVISLTIYSAIMLALFKLIPVTLTAAGIAGFILSIGMAVDANILIFERMKEELRNGRGIWDAMHEGFARAWTSIRDSNTSSIITGVILYYFSSSSIISGFALVFVIGVLVSMFTAITASRTLLYALAPKTDGRISRFLISNGFTKINSSKN